MIRVITILLTSITAVAFGQSADSDSLAAEGGIDEDLLGVWTAMDGGSIKYISFRPDGITIFNRVEEDDGYVHSIDVGRYGTSEGSIAAGKAASFWRNEEGGEWEEEEEYSEGFIISYEISDDRLTLGDPDESLEWIKSDFQVLVPNTVTLPDGSTSVERRSWGEMKASVAR